MSGPRRVVVASDFHLHPAKRGLLAAFRAFLDAARRDADRLLLLGDVFDYWFGPSQTKLDGWGAPLDALAAAAAEGLAIEIVPGNRDFLLGEEEAALAGARLWRDERVAEWHGRRWLFVHGDELCLSDRLHRATRPLLRSAAVRAAARVLPTGALDGAARALRALSRRGAAMRDLSDLDVSPEAVRRRIARGFDLVVCGHVHRPGIRECGVAAGRPARAAVLSDWSERGGVYGVVEPEGFRLVRHPSGETVAGPI